MTSSLSNVDEDAADREAILARIDERVGKKIRLRRTLLRMTQERLASDTGVTFEQVQQFERGVNPVPASRLYEVARVLCVPVSYFFEEGSASRPILVAAPNDASATEQAEAADLFAALSPRSRGLVTKLMLQLVMHRA